MVKLADFAHLKVYIVDIEINRIVAQRKVFAPSPLVLIKLHQVLKTETLYKKHYFFKI